MALSGQFSRTRVCPLLDQSRQRWILARDGLSAFDPKRTVARRLGHGVGPMNRAISFFNFQWH